MGIHSETAAGLFKQGYNCSQAVFAAFCDETGIDAAEALKISSSFGGGMGRMREVCGAVSGMFMVAGALYGYSGPDTPDEKKEHYKLIQDMAERFREENGSIVCRELLGLKNETGVSPIPSPRTKEYYKKRPCVEIVRCAARIMDGVIAEKTKSSK
jgi:C_GCAxxG_C_C family probable redox protein